MTLDDLLDALWCDYAALNPQAECIHRLLAARGETVRNDHVAFRTFADRRVGIDAITAPFTRLGYVSGGEYHFPDQKLFARHYDPPNPSAPKLFVSELLVDELGRGARAIVRRLVESVPTDPRTLAELPRLGRPWPISIGDYEHLRSESEYAAWLAAFGFRPNHFTVDVGALATFRGLADLDDFLESAGFALNLVGGRIKGSAASGLEQSATLAAEVDTAFDDGVLRIPGAYYEFARRHPMSDGRPFPGFVPESAGKLFRSTDHR